MSIGCLAEHAYLPLPQLAGIGFQSLSLTEWLASGKFSDSQKLKLLAWVNNEHLKLK
jgi:hypothetical protein